jgi:hypothetical protein
MKMKNVPLLKFLAKVGDFFKIYLVTLNSAAPRDILDAARIHIA